MLIVTVSPGALYTPRSPGLISWEMLHRGSKHHLKGLRQGAALESPVFQAQPCLCLLRNLFIVRICTRGMLESFLLSGPPKLLLLWEDLPDLIFDSAATSSPPPTSLAVPSYPVLCFLMPYVPYLSLQHCMWTATQNSPSGCMC